MDIGDKLILKEIGEITDLILIKWKKCKSLDINLTVHRIISKIWE
jgi:hypothetical protein